MYRQGRATHFVGRTLAAVAGAAARYSAFVVSFYIVLASVALTTAVTQLEIDTDTNDMIAGDLSFRRDFARLNETFPTLTDNFIAVVEADDTDVAREAAKSLVISFADRPDVFRHVYSPEISGFFDDHALLYLSPDRFAALADRVQLSASLLHALAQEPSLPGLARVVGGLASGAAGDPPPALADFLEVVQNVAAAQIVGHVETLDWEAVLSGPAVRPEDADGRSGPAHHFIFVSPVLDYSALEPAGVALAVARRLASDPEITRSDRVRINFTGEAAMASEELRTVADGAGLAGIISFCLVACVLIFGVGSGRLVGAALGMLAVGLALTAGFAALSIGHLNLISVAFAVLFVGLGVDFAIHFALRFDEECALPAHAPKVLAGVAAMTGPALALCTVTTGLAFLAFVPTDFAGMAQLGVISAGGMVIAFVLSMTLLPALLALGGDVVSRSRYRPPSWRFRTPGPELRKYLTILILATGVGALYVAPGAVFDGDPVALKDPESASVRTFLSLQGDRDAPSYKAELVVNDAGEARVMSRRLEEVHEVGDVISALDFVPTDQLRRIAHMQALQTIIPEPISNQLPDRGAAARKRALEELIASLETIGRDSSVPTRSRTAATRLRRTLEVRRNALSSDEETDRWLEVSLFAGFPPALSDFHRKLDAEPVTVNTLEPGLRSRYLSGRNEYRLDILPRESIDDEASMRRFVNAVKAVAPQATGAPVEIVGAADVVVDAMVGATGTAALMIGLVLFAALRRIGDVLLVLLPITLAGVLLVAATVFLDIPFNFANVIVLPLLIGLGVDSGIHLVMRIREDVTKGHRSELLKTSTPRAVLLSALTTVSSFGSLAVSSHRGTASMGELLTVATVLTLACTLIVLPTLVDWFLKPRHRRSFGR